MSVIKTSSSFLLALGLALLLAPGLSAFILDDDWANSTDHRANHTALGKANHTLPIHSTNHTHNGTLLGVRMVLGVQGGE
jgi:hypothetical protein